MYALAVQVSRLDNTSGRSSRCPVNGRGKESFQKPIDAGGISPTTLYYVEDNQPCTEGKELFCKATLGVVLFSLLFLSDLYRYTELATKSVRNEFAVVPSLSCGLILWPIPP
jgi:hypothetical protein